MTSAPNITKYTGLLHRHGVGSKQAKDYRAQHEYNHPFQHHCNVMDQVFEIKSQVTKVEG